MWDHQSGMVGDPAKVSDVEHRGRFFKVSGPLNTSPSPQDRPVLLRAPTCPFKLQIAQRRALDGAVAALGCDPETMGIVRQQPCFALGQNSRSVSRSVDRL
jgi:alkanesulfonate monooxygenase SsuD/methylene tetrahydromethanopterin reductase-like flavin-dependent oxidoreductase (luciferase family)